MNISVREQELVAAQCRTVLFPELVVIDGRRGLDASLYRVCK